MLYANIMQHKHHLEHGRNRKTTASEGVENADETRFVLHDGLIFALFVFEEIQASREAVDGFRGLKVILKGLEHFKALAVEFIGILKKSEGFYLSTNKSQLILLESTDSLIIVVSYEETIVATGVETNRLREDVKDTSGPNIRCQIFDEWEFEFLCFKCTHVRILSQCM